MKRICRASAGMAISVAFLATPTFAEVLEFTDKDEWIAAVGDYTTIDFTGHSQGEQVTDQYADLGTLFTDCFITFDESPYAYPNDRWGVDGNTGIHLEFDEPQLWIATEFPGVQRYELYKDGELMHISSHFGGSGYGWFGGLLLDTPFDEALIYDSFDDQVNVDDLYFGVPSPGVLPLMSIGLCFTRRRRA